VSPATKKLLSSHAAAETVTGKQQATSDGVEQAAGSILDGLRPDGLTAKLRAGKPTGAITSARQEVLAMLAGWLHVVCLELGRMGNPPNCEVLPGGPRGQALVVATVAALACNLICLCCGRRRRRRWALGIAHYGHCSSGREEDTAHLRQMAVAEPMKRWAPASEGGEPELAGRPQTTFLASRRWLSSAEFDLVGRRETAAAMAKLIELPIFKRWLVDRHASAHDV
jgi:hypothetical protein